MRQTQITVRDEIHGILAVSFFILLAVQGYLQSIPAVEADAYIATTLALLPFVIAFLKTLVAQEPGQLTKGQDDALFVIAATLTAAGAAITVITMNPVYLLIGGLLGAVAAGIRGYLGTIPPVSPAK